MSSRISIKEVCGQLEIGEEVVIDFVEYEIISPVEGESVEEWKFSPTEIAWFKKALRLKGDLELDTLAVAMVIDLLQKQESLENENTRLQKKLQRFMDDM